MLDTIQIPILLKAIDFVFEEGRKILEERRERRKVSAKTQEAEPQEEGIPVLPSPEKTDELKQGLLASKIDEGIWQNNEAEVRHLVNLLEIHSTNYHLASEQFAKWGSALVPPIVVHNMTEAENAFLETARQLEALLAKVYNKDIRSAG